MPVERGEIYFVSLDPVVGRETGHKVRPVAVLSINDINRKPLVVTVVPGTSAGTKPTHYRNTVLVPPTPTNGLTNETIFMCHQLRAIDKGRITSRPIGRLSPQHLELIEQATRYSLGLL
jgi:mRNA interferase MazF